MQKDEMIMFFLQRMFPVFILFGVLSAGAEGKFEQQASGVIATPFHGKKLTFGVFDAKWKNYSPGSFQRKQWRGNVFSGDWLIDGIRMTYRSEIRESGPATLQMKLEAKAEKPLKISTVFVSLEFPSDSMLEIDGKKRELPESYEKLEVYKYVPFRKIEITTEKQQVTLESPDPLSLLIADGRGRNQSCFSVRIMFRKTSPVTWDAALKFSIRKQKSEVLDIRKHANRGFSDDPSLPVRGWSGQGGGNDLSSLKAQNLIYSGVEFQILDPKKNNGRSVLVLGGKKRGQDVPADVTLPIPDSFPEFGAVNLLHAAAWPQKIIGTMEIQYTDGSSEKRTVDSQSVGNWWEPTERTNGVVVWEGENPAQRVGLYASTYPLKRKKIKFIRLSMANEESLWMIPAITFSSFPLSTKSIIVRDVRRVADSKWLPMDFKRCVVPGSPLDFSRFADAPAGKYGRVRISPDGHLYFEKRPGKRIRFFGTNLCFSACAPSHEIAEKMAKEIRKCGYNSVRLHHIDNGTLLNTSSPVSTELDPAKMERFDYLIHQLRQQGMYLTLDFYSSRTLKKGDGVPYNGKGYKALVVINKAARENLKKYIRNLMTHRNRYTRCSLAEDPALIAVNLVNEDYITGTWKSTPETTELFKKAFGKWTEKHGIRGAKAENVDPHFYRFLLETHQKAMQDLADFVRKELKCPVLLTSSNAHVDPLGAMLVRNFDFVDNHLYQDHPSYPEKAWSLPSAFKQKSSLEDFCRFPLVLAPTRIFGKPFFMTEYNICYPNQFRSECGPVVGALASLQNWDAVYRFAWSHGVKKLENQNSGIEGFDIVNDPVGLLAERITAAMFLRGDVLASDRKAALELSSDEFRKKDANFRSPELLKLGLLAQVGRADSGRPEVRFRTRSEIRPDHLPDPLLSARWTNLLNWKKGISSTNEIEFDPKEKNFSVISPKTESFTLRSGSLRGRMMSVRNPSSFATVALIALDDKELHQSREMLLLHLTNVNCTNMIFGSPQMTLLRNNGTLPYLVLRGSAEISLKSPHDFRITALTADGAPLGTVQGRRSGDTFQFKADTGCFKGGVMAYHLTR